MNDWLKEYRLKAKMTQEQVSKVSGISRPFYNMVENGARKPSVKYAKSIASVLNFNWTLFFADDSQSENTA